MSDRGPVTPAWKFVSVIVLPILGVVLIYYLTLPEKHYELTDKQIAAIPTPRTPQLSEPAPTPTAGITTPSIDPAKPDFDLGENLTYDELKAISDRVMAEKARRKLSDRAALELSNKEIRRASMARWQRDGKTWIIRDKSSPLYKK
jgi:hypothetical protein